MITVKYGKEGRGELEVGDALFESDPNLKIRRTRFGGVLTLHTTLNYDEVLSKLTAHPPATVERVVKIDFCCKLGEDLVSCLINSLRGRKAGFGTIKIGRKGSLSDKELREIKDCLRGLISEGDNRVLDIEPIDNSVCYGIFREGLDKAVTEARKRLTLY